MWLTNQQIADHILQTICTYDENSNAMVLGRGRRGQRWALRNQEREPSRLDDWLYVWGEGGVGREQSLEWLHGKQQLWNQVATTVERQAFGLGWSWGSIHRLCEASETFGSRSQVGSLTKEQVRGEAEWRQLSLYLKRWSGPISLEIPTWEAYWDELTSTKRHLPGKMGCKIRENRKWDQWKVQSKYANPSPLRGTDLVLPVLHSLYADPALANAL